jgi:hypothetical protein
LWLGLHFDPEDGGNMNKRAKAKEMSGQMHTQAVVTAE